MVLRTMKLIFLCIPGQLATLYVMTTFIRTMTHTNTFSLAQTGTIKGLSQWSQTHTILYQVNITSSLMTHTNTSSLAPTGTIKGLSQWSQTHTILYQVNITSSLMTHTNTFSLAQTGTIKGLSQWSQPHTILYQVNITSSNHDPHKHLLSSSNWNNKGIISVVPTPHYPLPGKYSILPP